MTVADMSSDGQDVSITPCDHRARPRTMLTGKQILHEAHHCDKRIFTDEWGGGGSLEFSSARLVSGIDLAPSRGLAHLCLET